MNRKELFKALILLKQEEVPFAVLPRERSLPVDGGKIYTVPGVRRCGKSTLMELAINELLKRGVTKQQILWVGFDDERLSGLTPENLNELLESYMELFPDIPLKEVYMFFDEIPLVPDWELFVLRVYKSYCKNLFICGSNARMLSREMKSCLRGWPLELECFPLNFKEFCSFKGITENLHQERTRAKIRHVFDDFLHFGGMPEVVLERDESTKTARLQTYFDTMLLRDFIEHWKITNPQVLRYFLKRVLGGLANPISVNAIANDIRSQGVKLTKDDLYVWLQNACDIYLLFKVPKFSRSILQEQNSLAKYYVIDNGLRNAVIPLQSDDAGKQLENTVFLELLQKRKPQERISYFQERQGCDFVISYDENVRQLIQVTWDLSDDKTRKREINGLLAASESTSCQNLMLLTYDTEEDLEINNRHIRILPVWKWCWQ